MGVELKHILRGRAVVMGEYVRDITIRAEGNAVLLTCEREGCGWSSSWGDLSGRAAFSSVLTRAVDHAALCRHPEVI